MNVFTLSTGRCGSTTFERACSHITNFTAEHESRVNQLGEERLNYPLQHIESDNRLSWFLGRLDKKYQDNNVLYVHLIRDEKEVAQSYAKRFKPGLIMPAYADGIYIDLPPNKEPFKQDIALDYARTVNQNIELFLKDKKNKMVIYLPEIKDLFPEFWQIIGAKGDIDAACKEFDINYNYAGSGSDLRLKEKPVMIRAGIKSIRIIRKLPGFLRNA
jgi:hypothetical protein